jgi:hypothetical protein
MNTDANHPDQAQSATAGGGNVESVVPPAHHPHPAAAAIAAWARDELAALTGYKVDSISGLEKIDEGWQLTVVVIELQRIPASTDILATYEVTLDESGDIVNYHRGDRYLRGQLGEHL